MHERSLKKQALMVEAVEAIRTAVIRIQNVELAILEAGEGRISADFLMMERQESNLVDILQRLERYRAELPQVHPWFKPKVGA
jgi:hypothetical protein